MMRRLAAVAAGLLAVAGLAAVPSVASATTGYCTGDGINAVVDFTALGGAVQRFCDPGGVGKSAGQVFEDVGAHLTRVQQYPGAVCRVENRPASAGCQSMPPADAYWGLFWSKGSGWTYSSEGVDNLTVPNGGTVAFAWQTSSSPRPPSVAPAHPARPRPTPRPTPAPTHSAPSPKPTAATHSTPRHSSGPSATANPASAGKHAGRHHRAQPPAKARHRAATPVRTSGSLCGTRTGVNVVVDPGSLGGRIAEGCAPGAGGRTGDRVIPAAGFPLRYVPDQPGFICTVAHRPRHCAMPGAGDPYWGLFSSDGSSRTWKQATVGVDQLKVADGGSLALVWEDGRKPVPPRVAAPLSPRSDSASPTATASATPLAAAADHTPAPTNGGGMPVWVPVVVIVALLGVGGAVAVRRRGAA